MSQCSACPTVHPPLLRYDFLILALKILNYLIHDSRNETNNEDPKTEIHSPIIPNILPTLVSLCVIQSSRSGSFLPRTTPESPTWPMYNFESRRKQTVAVVPAVEGRPDAVLGHPAAGEKVIHDATSLSLLSPSSSLTTLSLVFVRVITGHYRRCYQR